ncbi:hypothetical protein [Hymenobacter persicinus]|uniref:Uncharacterized protein n=1 Tax=Hymenobacter persicinus TaxID=2025506 RepID=A0A4Q5LH87_9BACT|nr:hypothetical protein [Hymenobacter persicinus]RYU81313.1 hypothetical protein EWM57_06980 [Hymenobacter persicinus]
MSIPNPFSWLRRPGRVLPYSFLQLVLVLELALARTSATRRLASPFRLGGGTRPASLRPMANPALA